MALDLRAARATAQEAYPGSQIHGQGHPKIEWVQAYATQDAEVIHRRAQEVIHRRRSRKQRSNRLPD